MNEEIKKEAQDMELSLENLDKVAGGEMSFELIGKVGNEYMYVAKCPYCSYHIQFPATSSPDEVEEQMKQHIRIYHPTGEPLEDYI